MHDDDEAFWLTVMLLPTQRDLTGEDPYDPFGLFFKILGCIFAGALILGLLLLSGLMLSS